MREGLSIRLNPAAAAALQWLVDQGDTPTGATRTAIIALAQARGMASRDIEARVGAIEERLRRLDLGDAPADGRASAGAGGG